MFSGRHSGFIRFGSSSGYCKPLKCNSLSRKGHEFRYAMTCNLPKGHRFRYGLTPHQWAQGSAIAKSHRFRHSSRRSHNADQLPHNYKLLTDLWPSWKGHRFRQRKAWYAEGIGFTGLWSLLYGHKLNIFIVHAFLAIPSTGTANAIQPEETSDGGAFGSRKDRCCRQSRKSPNDVGYEVEPLDWCVIHPVDAGISCGDAGDI